MVAFPNMSPAEAREFSTILSKDREIRSFLEAKYIDESTGPLDFLEYLNSMKNIIGNINNDVGFAATLIVKQYLKDRFQIVDFDAAGKAQGAPGYDITAKTPGGSFVVGELKTTKPYQPGFGAQQRTTILKDLARLASSTAEHRFMFVIDPETFQALCGRSFALKAPGVEIVNLVEQKTFLLY